MTFTVAAGRSWGKAYPGDPQPSRRQLVRYEKTRDADVKSFSRRQGVCLPVGDYRVIEDSRWSMLTALVRAMLQFWRAADAAARPSSLPLLPH
jgi:hypothetical protein